MSEEYEREAPAFGAALGSNEATPSSVPAFGAALGWAEGEPDQANVPGGYSDENLRAAWDGTPELAEAASDAHVCGFSDPNPVCCAGLEREPDGSELEARQAELEAEA
jgi:hypothetical protein